MRGIADDPDKDDALGDDGALGLTELHGAGAAHDICADMAVGTPDRKGAHLA
jgi:hypothetical protein